MDTKESLLKTLTTLKPELRARYKVKGIGLFGSFVRDEERESSDVDILVDLEDGATLIDLIRLGDFLESELGRKVDVVTKRSLQNGGILL
ncbi:MAG: nucleotidyltransferase family protein [Anaerolineae bacterium]|nr:nucleotidyltransferase family protein [Anaerolineae bacterium]